MLPELSKYIQDFIRPKIKTPLEWADFYIAKTDRVRYKVGMKFKKYGYRTYTIIEITSTYILTYNGFGKELFTKQYGYFDYMGFEWCEGLRWSQLDTIEKFQFLENIMLYKYAMYELSKNPTRMFITMRDDNYANFLEDYKKGYAIWGNTII